MKDLSPAELQAAAVSLIRLLEEKRSGLRRAEAKELAHSDKQVLALFLTPAAQSSGIEAVSEFASVLNRIWNETYPKNAYYAGSFESIMKGFDANLLGLPLRKSRKR